MPYNTLITTETLATHLRAGWLIADCRYDLQSGTWGEDEYVAGHIPGAVYVSLSHDLSSTPTGANGRHPLPSPEAMTGRMLDRVDKIQRTSPEPRRRPQPEEGSLSILFEDDTLVVLDKPAGVVVHPTYKNTSGTLLNALLWRYRDRDLIQPGILTRLDKDTSGVVVVALTPVLHAAMQRDM